MSQTPKIAFVHEWLINKGGSESVLEAMLEIYPDAPIFTVIADLDGDCKSIMSGHEIHQTFIANLPGAKKWYRNYLALMPLAIEQLDLSDYDMVISSSHAVAKGVITGPDQFHLSYVHSPIRYAWDLQHQYLEEAALTKGIKSLVVRVILHYIRNWDLRTSNGVDAFLCNSNFVARRIMKVYRRQAEVLYPPVDVSGFTLGDIKEDYYLTASRMVPYKKIDLIVQAFSQMPEKRLMVIGSGTEFEKIKRKAGPNVEMRGYQPIEELKKAMQRAKAFVFAAEEDFGIVPVESQACGTPVIAYSKGGALETVIAGKTGVFFDKPTTESLVSAIQKFEKMPPFNPVVLRKNAERFSKQRFQLEFQTSVDQAWKEHQKNLSVRRTKVFYNTPV